MPIKPLPPEVFNQIAAGEVVERPASIVKELIENSVDANASIIEVDIENGGIDFIRIKDDGKGICKKELALALMPHATSKIASIDDLQTISSFGFRGEALASISSVCLFSITSKPKTESYAYSIHNHQGVISEPEPKAHPNGTTIECRSLFYNVPVRRKFFKQPKTEFLHTETVVKRLAMANEQVTFILKHNSRVVLHLKASRDKSAVSVRLAQVFGKSFVKQSLPVAKSSNGMSLLGWVSSPTFLRGQSDLQYMYVNQRIVRDKLINQVIRKVYESLLYPGKVPSYLLYFTILPQEVDVNVHPAKYEVRFEKPKDVHDFIYSALQDALSAYQEEELGEVSSLTHSACEETSVREACANDGITMTEQVSMSNYSSSLIPLGHALALLIEGDKTHLFDVKAMYGQWLKQCLLKRIRLEEIVSRVVLVPLTVEIERELIEQYPFDIASQLGFELSVLMENKLVVRRLPALLTHLDIHESVKALAFARDIDEALDVLMKHQSLALTDLSDEEKRLLAAFVCSQTSSSTNHRILSEKDLAEVLGG